MSQFEECLSWVLVREGGYVNHPKDPGGHTNQGITLRTLSAFYGRAATVGELKNISPNTVAAIYRQRFWDKVRADDLPAGIDLVTFNIAVMSGPRRAIRFLQRAVGVDDDGILGPITMDAVTRVCGLEPKIIRSMINDYRGFLRRLPHYPTFGLGWRRRMDKLKTTALGMVV